MKTIQVSVNGWWMNREDRNIKLWEGNILPSFNHEKKGNPAICNNMVGSWGNYAKWSKPDWEKKNTACYHLYVESE